MNVVPCPPFVSVSSVVAPFGADPCNLFDLMVRSRWTRGSPCRRTARLIVFEPPLSKEVEHEWAVTGLEGTVAADGRGVSRARRQASRVGRSPPRTRL